MYPALEGDYKAHGYIYPLAGETPALPGISERQSLFESRRHRRRFTRLQLERNESIAGRMR